MVYRYSTMLNVQSNIYNFSRNKLFREIYYTEFQKAEIKRISKLKFLHEKILQRENIFEIFIRSKNSFLKKFLVYQILPVQRNILLRKVLSHRRIAYMYHIYLYIYVCVILLTFTSRYFIL